MYFYCSPVICKLILGGSRMDIFHQQVHPFSKYLLSIYYLLGTLLVTDDSSEQETKTLALMGLIIF